MVYYSCTIAHNFQLYQMLNLIFYAPLQVQIFQKENQITRASHSACWRRDQPLVSFLQSNYYFFCWGRSEFKAYCLTSIYNQLKLKYVQLLKTRTLILAYLLQETNEQTWKIGKHEGSSHLLYYYYAVQATKKIMIKRYIMLQIIK